MTACIDERPAPSRRSATDVPLWLGLFVVVLLVIVFVLAGVLIWVTMGTFGGDTSAGSVEALETQARDTDDPALLVDLGFEYRKAGRFEEALDTFERALRLDPRNTAALYHEGAVLIDMGQHERAESVFWNVLEVDPTHAMTAKALGELYASRGQYRSLLVAVRPAAEANAALADLQYLLGLGLENTGDAEGAARAFWRARELDPNLDEARDGLERLGGGSP